MRRASGNLLGGWQFGMAADEQQPQHIVAIVRTVQPLGQFAFRIAQVRDLIIGRQFRGAALLAHSVQRRIAPHQNQPGGRIARRALVRPAFQSAQAGILERFFGPVHVAEIAQQRPHRLRAGRRQRAMDPSQIGHQ